MSLPGVLKNWLQVEGAGDKGAHVNGDRDNSPNPVTSQADRGHEAMGRFQCQGGEREISIGWYGEGDRESQDHR